MRSSWHDAAIELAAVYQIDCSPSAQLYARKTSVLRPCAHRGGSWTSFPWRSTFTATIAMHDLPRQCTPSVPGQLLDSSRPDSCSRCCSLTKARTARKQQRHLLERSLSEYANEVREH